MNIVKLDTPALRRTTPAANAEAPEAANDAEENAVAPRGWPCVVTVRGQQGPGGKYADRIELVAGLGTTDDAGLGGNGVPRSAAVARLGPDSPHPIIIVAAELFDDLRALGIPADPDLLAGNVMIRGLDLHKLPPGTELHIGGPRGPVVRLALEEDPSSRVAQWLASLDAAVGKHLPRGASMRGAAVDGVVVVSGVVSSGDAVSTRLPRLRRRQLPA